MKNIINRIKKKIKVTLSREMKDNDIDLEELNRMMKQENAILIDVRSPQEYKEGHLEGAILIPEYEIGKVIESKVKDKNANIILYCSSGGRSKRAEKTLKNKGYQKVYNLYNGLMSY